MMYSEFIPRRLSQSGCVVAGTRLAANYDKLKQQKIKLAPKVDAAVQSVIHRTEAVAQLTTSEATMVEIDRSTDRCIAAFDDLVDAIERGFDHAAIVPLSDAESARLADAKLVRGALLPVGTSFLKLSYSQQWVRMSAVVKALGEKDVAAACKRLGLEVETARICRWVDLYGARLGVTEAKDADPAAVTIDGWHEAYGELIVRTHAEYDSATDEADRKIREVLLGPYTAQADEERRAAQKAREKRKAAESTEE